MRYGKKYLPKRWSSSAKRGFRRIYGPIFSNYVERDLDTAQLGGKESKRLRNCLFLFLRFFLKFPDCVHFPCWQHFGAGSCQHGLQLLGSFRIGFRASLMFPSGLVFVFFQSWF